MTRVFGILIVLSVLTGCIKEQPNAEMEATITEQRRTIEQLRKEVHDTEDRLADREQRIAELDRWIDRAEDQAWFRVRYAALARACDWLIPICPEPWISQGRKALDDGYKGTISGVFWVAMAGKIAVFLLVPLAVSALAFWCYWSWGQSAVAQVREAQSDLKSIECSRLDKAQEVDHLEASIADHRTLLRDLGNQVSSAKLHLKEVEQAIQDQEAKRDKLRSGFK